MNFKPDDNEIINEMPESDFESNHNKEIEDRDSVEPLLRYENRTRKENKKFVSSGSTDKQISNRAEKIQIL